MKIKEKKKEKRMLELSKVHDSLWSNWLRADTYTRIILVEIVVLSAWICVLCSLRLGGDDNFFKEKI